MKILIVPLIMGFVGFAAGGGAGFYLRAPAEDMVSDGHKQANDQEQMPIEDKVVPEEMALEYVKLNNQFVVPIVDGDLVNALVVMSLSIEISQGETSAVYAVEPKLRDAFLQVLFDHANMGGFKGEFTEARNMNVLRDALKDTAQAVVGELVTGVLITDIARQDI